MSKDETITVDGPRVAAQILTRFPAEDRQRIVEAIRISNPTAAIKIEEMVVADAKKPSFQHITQLDNKKLQNLLRQVPHHDVVVSLKRAPEEVRDKILLNLSETRQRQVEEDIQELPKMHVSDVEAAQNRIMKRLEELYPETAPSTRPRRLQSRLA
jgi:flagellar motor switch protein FliG